MTTRDLIEALKDATPPEMREIRRLLAINAPEHFTRDELLAEMLASPRPSPTTGFGGYNEPHEVPKVEP